MLPMSMYVLIPVKKKHVLSLARVGREEVVAR